jgi:hypothetical protein
MVNDLYLDGVSIFPAETDPPLVVDTNAPLPISIALELFKPIARRRLEIVHEGGSIKHSELSQSNALERAETIHSFAMEEPLRIAIGKGTDHRSMRLQA